MLYHLARFYDEWPGEDYEGSSCRGAMKVRHRHGVCSEEFWPYRDAQGNAAFLPPNDGWQQDAARRTLGEYYRINRQSVSDMQAAVYETGAIYVSAQVHAGWTPFSPLPRSCPDDHRHGAKQPQRARLCHRRLHAARIHRPEFLGRGLGVPRLRDPAVRRLGPERHGRVGGGLGRAGKAPMGAEAAAAADIEYRFSRDGPWRCRSQRPGWEVVFRGRATRPPSTHTKTRASRRGTTNAEFHHMLVMGNNGLPLNRLVVQQKRGGGRRESVRNLAQRVTSRPDAQEEAGHLRARRPQLRRSSAESHADSGPLFSREVDLSAVCGLAHRVPGDARPGLQG